MAEQELAKRQHAEVTRREKAEDIFVPPADIWETEEEIVIRMDMPGVAKDHVDIQIERDTLTVRGHVSTEIQGKALYAEQRIGDFRREFTLSEDLDRDKISADMDSGVLTIHVGKAEAVKPRKVEIASAT